MSGMFADDNHALPAPSFAMHGGDADIESATSQPVPQRWLLPFALVLSVAAHLLVFSWTFPHRAGEVAATATTIHISLVSPVAAPETPPPEFVAQSPNTVALAGKLAPPAVREPDPVPDSHLPAKMERQVSVTPVTETAVNAAIARSSHYSIKDLDLPASGNLDFADRAAGPHETVFDPRLRARLRARQPAQQAQQNRPQEITTLHQEKFVELDNGACLKARASLEAGNATDWYFTRCVGRKSEGENMLERVNQAIKMRNP